MSESRFERADRLFDEGEYEESRNLLREYLWDEGPRPRSNLLWLATEHDHVRFCKELAAKFPENLEAQKMEIEALCRAGGWSLAGRKCSELLSTVETTSDRVALRNLRVRVAVEGRIAGSLAEDVVELWRFYGSVRRGGRVRAAIGWTLTFVDTPVLVPALNQIGRDLPPLKPLLSLVVQTIEEAERLKNESRVSDDPPDS